MRPFYHPQKINGAWNSRHMQQKNHACKDFPELLITCANNHEEKKSPHKTKCIWGGEKGKISYLAFKLSQKIQIVGNIQVTNIVNLKGYLFIHFFFQNMSSTYTALWNFIQIFEREKPKSLRIKDEGVRNFILNFLVLFKRKCLFVSYRLIDWCWNGQKLGMKDHCSIKNLL